MSGHEYRPGGWTALVTDDALALLPPGVSEDVARELWQLSATGTRLGAWVEYLAAAGISALPSFAMVEAHPEGLRVLVRGEVDVEQDGRVVSGRGLTTWREELLPAADVTVRAETTDAGWLPVTGGIVRASAARLLASPQPAPAPPEDEEDVELTVARMPALAAAVGVRPATAPATGPAADAGTAGAVADASDAPPAGGLLAAVPPAPDVRPAPASAPVPATLPTPAPPAAAPATPDPALAAAPPAVAPTTPDPAPAPVPASDAETAATADEPDDESDEAPPAPPAPPVPPSPPAPPAPPVPSPVDAVAEEEPEDSDDYDFLLWSTEQVHAHRSGQEPAPDAEPGDAEPAAAVPAEPAEPAEPGLPDLEATRLPEPEEDATGTFAPGGIIDSVPGLSRPAAPVGAPVDLPPPPAAEPGDDGDHDGETIATSEIPATATPVAHEPAPRPAPGVELVLSTGPRIEMDRPVLLGRAPEATRFAGTEVPRLVSVSNPERDISSTHVEVRPAGGHVVVTDMNSTNGTVVHLPDQPSFRLQPGTGVPVGPGAVIELGVGVELTVQRVEGAQ